MTMPSLKHAFFIHFGVSLLIFLVLALIMRMVWFPGDLFTMDGGWQGIKIIAPIDLILGPALTLGFYRTWKKNLKLDMAMIATVQIAALCFGVFTAYQQRTAAIVFAETRFETLSYTEFKAATKEMEEKGLEPKTLKEFGPKMPVIIHAKSFNAEEFGDYLADLLNGLPELRERSDRYQPIQQARSKIAEYRISAQQDGTTIEVASSSVGNSSGNPLNAPDNEVAEIYPLKARYIDGTIEFDPSTFEMTKITRNTTSD